MRFQDIFVACLKKNRTDRAGGPDTVSGQETAPAQKPSVTVYHEAALRVERQALLRSLLAFSKIEILNSTLISRKIEFTLTTAYVEVSHTQGLVSLVPDMSIPTEH